MVAVRLSVSIPSELDARMRAAGLSASSELVAALEAKLGNDRQPSLLERLAELERTTTSQGRRIAKLEKAARAPRPVRQGEIPVPVHPDGTPIELKDRHR